jgi:hypothetical protein
MVAVVVRGKKTIRAGHSALCRYLESLEAIPYHPFFGAQKPEIGPFSRSQPENFLAI